MSGAISKKIYLWVGKHTPSHNHIFVLLGEKLGGLLPPIAMVPAAGLFPDGINV